ncbi:MAG TPA: SpoIIE family protein phosphatase [Bryobacteraceae bacterium]|nr:SpoIIE family protein phosphatase [Bryobacteraceae bacterium]
MVPELSITAPDGKTRTIRLESNALTLGRSSANELCFPDDVGLSRQHMALERDSTGWTVRDLGSKNGTFLNGARIGEASRLRPGDRVIASRIVLVFDPVEADAAKTVLFEGTSAAGPSALTVSTTLEHLLKGETKEKSPLAPQWGSPVTALVRAGRELAARRPLPELFGVILNLAIEAVGARRGVLMTLEKGQLVAQAQRGENFRISTAVRDRVLDAKTSLLVRDAQRDEALRQRFSIVEHSVRTLMAVPLQTDNQVIGLIYVDSPQFAREFTSDDLNLLTVMANVAAMRIERDRLAEIEQAEKLMANELEQAAEIQRQFLPSAAPQVPGLELAGYNAACRTVGGDYYDFLAYPDGRVGIVIADVAGKGMPAALLMTSLQAKVQALAETPVEPAAAVARLNRSLFTTCPRNRFVTLFFSVADPRTGEIAFCNGGHNPPLLVRASGEIVRLEGGGPVLGILPAMTFSEHRERLEPGDMVVLYSDGVTEACNPEGLEFEDCLVRLAPDLRGRGAADAVRTVHEAVRDWIAGQPPADDVTVVILRRTD